jgi:hypothetical protein
MRRARAILTSLIPTLLLVGSLDFFSNLNHARPCHRLFASLSADGHDEHGRPSDGNLFDQAVQRSSRRLNVNSGAGGFAPPACLVSSQIVVPAHNYGYLTIAPANLELVQSWQFYWRTALEPRAPSLVS